jgi:hypothetical protein
MITKLERQLTANSTEHTTSTNTRKNINTIDILKMTTDSNSQQATNGNTAPITASDTGGATPLQIGLGLIILGSSAGLTLYTKKTQSLLNQMKRVDQNKAMRLPKKKFGPMTKPEWERMRSRWTKDDL